MDNLVNGLSISLIGIVIVMAILALLSAVVSIFGRINKPRGGVPKPESQPAETDNADEEQDAGVSPELVAVIAAAVCAASGKNPGEFKILSVRRAVNWNAAARREQLKRLS